MLDNGVKWGPVSEMNKKERRKRNNFRNLVEKVRKFSREGETRDPDLKYFLYLINIGKETPSDHHPIELETDIRQISEILSEEDRLEFERMYCGTDNNPRIRELEEGSDYRRQKIREFLQKHRHVRRIVPISERLEISDERLEELARRIKPVVRCDGDLYYILDVDLRNVAFTWDPKLKERAEGLEELVRIRTYHIWNYYGFFKPSIAEVLAQIPKTKLLETSAFEIPIHITDPDPEIVGDYHKARTILYKKIE